MNKEDVLMINSIIKNLDVQNNTINKNRSNYR